MDLVKRIAKALLFTILFSYVVVPTLAVIIGSFATKWFRTILPSVFTLKNYIDVFTRRDIFPHLTSSLLIALLSVLFSVFIVLPAIFYLAINPRSKVRYLFEMIVLAPIMIPPLILSIAILTLYAHNPLRDTPFIVVFAHVILSMPYAFRTLRAGTQLIDVKTLIEAARSLGASPLQTFTRVIMPALAPYIASSSLMTFAISLGDFEIANILAPWRFRTAPLVLYQMFFKNSWIAAALASILIIVSISASLIIAVITRKSIGQYMTPRGE